VGIIFAPQIQPGTVPGGVLAGTAEDGVTWSRPKNPADLNKLHGWVDSDFAADPDNRRSTSGYEI